MLETLGATLPFFALTLCGYIARWRGIMGAGSATVLNNFVLYFALPAFLARTLAALPIETLLVADFLLTWALVSVAMFSGVALLTAVVIRQRGADAIIQAAACTHGNIGYLGLPLVVTLLGQQVVATVSMAIMLDLVIVIPATIAALELLGASRPRSVLATLRHVSLALATNPFVIAIFVGLFLSFAQLDFPAGVDEFLRILGTAAIPTALFAIGVTLYGQPIGAAWMEIATLCIVKLFVHPLAIYLVATEIFELAPQIVIAATLLAAMPLASNIFILATRFDARPSIISGAILVSTAAALITFNVWAAVLFA